MPAQKLTYGPAGVHVAADDGHHTLSWKDIVQSDLGHWVVGGDTYGRDYLGSIGEFVTVFGLLPEIEQVPTQRTEEASEFLAIDRPVQMAFTSHHELVAEYFRP